MNRLVRTIALALLCSSPLFSWQSTEEHPSVEFAIGRSFLYHWGLEQDIRQSFEKAIRGDDPNKVVESFGGDLELSVDFSTPIGRNLSAGVTLLQYVITPISFSRFVHGSAPGGTGELGYDYNLNKTDFLLSLSWQSGILAPMPTTFEVRVLAGFSYTALRKKVQVMVLNRNWPETGYYDMYSSSLSGTYKQYPPVVGFSAKVRIGIMEGMQATFSAKWIKTYSVGKNGSFQQDGIQVDPQTTPFFSWIFYDVSQDYSGFSVGLGVAFELW